MADTISRELGITPQLVEGDRGEFTVWVGDDKVAKKGLIRFPSDADVVSAVRRALDTAAP